MSLSRFLKYKSLYYNSMPFIAMYSTIIGISTGCTENNRLREGNSIDIYSNYIGYTSIGIITGITYPISFPLLGGYVLYKNINNK